MSETIDQYTNDVSQLKIRLLDELVFWPERSRQSITYRIEIPSRHKYFTVGHEEYVFISLLDGNTTTAAACGQAAQALGREALSQQQATAVVRWLMQNGLIHSTSDDAPPSQRFADRPAPHPNLMSRLNPFWIKIPIIQSPRAMASVTPLLKWIFDVRCAMAAILVMIVALFTVGMQWERFIAASESIFSPSTWVWTFLIWIALKFVHELAHASSCHRYGGETKEVGVVFVLLAPLAYVDVTSSWRLRSKWHRIAIAAAGMYVELTLAAIAAIIWGFVDAPLVSHLLFNTILAASVSTLLFNANPLMRFDGYYMLTDLLEVPNLYGEGSQAVRNAACKFFFARTTGRAQNSGWRRVFITAYGIASFAWRIVICISLAIGAAYMFKGAGIVLVGFGIVLWIVKPLRNIYRAIAEKLSFDPPAGLRAIIVGSSLAMITGSVLFYLPFSTAITTPAVVDYADGAIVRCRSNGFITEVLVHDGQVVRQGDTLIQLKNSELQQQADDLSLQIRQSEIRSRAATEKHDMASAQVERKDRQASIQRLAQIQEQRAELTVKAHRDGIVVARGIQDRVGTYITEGDELLVVADAEDKQLVLSIAQEDIKQATGLIGTKVSLCTASQHHAIGTLTRVEPTASRHLPHEAMAGINAGPLSVRAAESEEDESAVKLLEPRFKAIIDLPAEQDASLPVGQRVRAYIGHQRLTVFQRLRLRIEKMLQVARSLETTS